MRKTELRELYKMMFPDYPDIVTVAQLQKMLGISRHLAYDLINDGYISGIKIGKTTEKGFGLPWKKRNPLSAKRDRGLTKVRKMELRFWAALS